jgi:Family of unknown function (DUF5681)
MAGDKLKQQQAGQPIQCEPEVACEKMRKGKHQVGYGRPPVHTQFKAGRSGNRRGRPVGRANAKTTMARVFNQTVPVREGDKTRNMSKLEAMLQTHTLKAMKGDNRSASIVIGLLARAGFLGESESKTVPALSDEDDAILDDFVRRRTGAAERDPANHAEER